MALAADFNLEFRFGGADDKFVSAGAAHLGSGVISRMNLSFH